MPHVNATDHPCFFVVHLLRQCPEHDTNIISRQLEIACDIAYRNPRQTFTCSWRQQVSSSLFFSLKRSSSEKVRNESVPHMKTPQGQPQALVTMVSSCSQTVIIGACLRLLWLFGCCAIQCIRRQAENSKGRKREPRRSDMNVARTFPSLFLGWKILHWRYFSKFFCEVWLMK